MTLLRDGVLDYGGCLDRFGISRREFQRDLRKVREIGQEFGFTASRVQRGRVFLHTGNTRTRRVSKKEREKMATLARIAASLGGPAEREIREAVGELPADDRRGFLHVRRPAVRESDRVTGNFTVVKEAAESSARLEFCYKPARGARAVRRVEPYHVVERSGRYYLVAYDLTRRDWRYFALDAIAGPFRKDGTFTPRLVPGKFLAERAVGWIRGAASAEVTIRFDSAVAASVTSRTWQEGQRVVMLPDGGVEVMLAVDDINEAVRFALSYGDAARVVAPDAAVALARETLAKMMAGYTSATSTAVEEQAG